MIDEVMKFKEMGGTSIVEVTTSGIVPNFEFLREVSTATGVNIICGTGYYLGYTLADDIKESSVDELVQVCLHTSKVLVS